MSPVRWYDFWLDNIWIDSLPSYSVSVAIIRHSSSIYIWHDPWYLKNSMSTCTFESRGSVGPLPTYYIRTTPLTNANCSRFLHVSGLQSGLLRRDASSDDGMAVRARPIHDPTLTTITNYYLYLASCIIFSCCLFSRVSLSIAHPKAQISFR